MSLLLRSLVRFNEAVGGLFDKAYRSQLRTLEGQNELLQESLSRIQLEMENDGWQRLTQFGDWEFSRHKLDDIHKISIAMAFKNPLIKRSVNVQADYVFAQGVRVTSDDPEVQTVIDDFWDDPRNQRVLTSHPALLQRERELQVMGNLFFALFSTLEGTQIRCLDPREVMDVYRNPDDYSEPWFYKRVTSSIEGGSPKVLYYPAVGVVEGGPAFLPDTAESGDTVWDCRVFHLHSELYGKQKFALPDVYAALDWALAYKRILEDWATIMRSFARMAMKIVNLSGKKGTAAAKSLLQTSVSPTQIAEKNPSAVAGSTGLFAGNVDIQPVKTAGATTSPDEGKPVLNMVAASVGLPNTFYGDASVGNFATAKTLDRPTELKILSRQALWAYVFIAVLRYVCESQGIRMKGKRITPIFPSILERNITDRVRAVVNAITLFGKPLYNLIPDRRLACRLVLEALGVDNIEAHLKEFEGMWKEGIVIEPPPAPTPGGGAEDPSQGGDTGENG